MSLDLYYSNFNNVGESLEKMYQTFLFEDFKCGVVTGQPRKLSKSEVESKRLQSAIEGMNLTKKSTEPKKVTPAPRNLRVQIGKTDQVNNAPGSSMRNAPGSPMRNPPGSPMRNVPSSPLRFNASGSPAKPAPTSPQKTSPEQSKNSPGSSQRNRSEPRRSSSVSSFRSEPGRGHRNAPKSPRRNRQDELRASHGQRNDARNASGSLPRNEIGRRSGSPSRNGPTSPNKSYPRSSSQSSPRSPYKSSSSSHIPPQSPTKKLSPQELRSKKSPTPHRVDSAIDKPKVQSTNSLDHDSLTSAEGSLQNGNDENILRQQNSRDSTPSSTTPAKCKVSNSKVYFREENVENLEWNGETSFDGDCDDPDASTSPKVNPYSSSFLNFLSSN